MPLRTLSVKNPRFLRHHGVAIYHTYRHDDADDCIMDYWYTQDPWSDRYAFDVRELSTYTSDGPGEHRAAIINAINNGEIKKELCDSTH